MQRLFLIFYHNKHYKLKFFEQSIGGGIVYIEGPAIIESKEGALVTYNGKDFLFMDSKSGEIKYDILQESREKLVTQKDISSRI